MLYAILVAVLALFVAGVLAAGFVAAVIVQAVVWLIERSGLWRPTRTSGDSAS